MNAEIAERLFNRLPADVRAQWDALERAWTAVPPAQIRTATLLSWEVLANDLLRGYGLEVHVTQSDFSTVNINISVRKEN